MALCAAWAMPARAQDPADGQGVAVEAIVEQVAGRDVWLRAAGDVAAFDRIGAGVRDTVEARAGTRRFRAELLARSEARVVIRFLDGDATIAVGDTVRISPLRTTALEPRLPSAVAAGVDTLAAERGADTLPAGSETPAAPADVRPPPLSPAGSPRGSAAHRGPRVDGRIGISAATVHSSGQWPEAGERWSRTDATPAARLYLRVDHLPGDVRLSVSARGDRRIDMGGGIDVPSAVHLYDAHVERTFQVVPLHMRFGRFRNPYETYAEPIDGALLRMGVGAGFGVGALAGFLPLWSRAELHTEHPTARAFVDFERSVGRAYVRGAVSAGREWPDSGAARTSAAWSQSIARGVARLTADTRLDQRPESGWSVAELQVAGALRPVESVRLHARHSRSDAAWTRYDWAALPTRSRSGVGASWTPGPFSAGVDAGTTRTEPALDPDAPVRTGRSLALWALADRSPLLGIGAGLALSWWRDDDFASVQIAPSLSRSFGGARLRLDYRREQTDGTDAARVMHGFGGSLVVPIRAFRLHLSADHRNAGGVATTRVFTSLEARL